MRFIVNQLLEGSLKNPSHRGTKYGYTVEELLESLSRLAINKNNAAEMVKVNVIQICDTVLNENFDENELKWALKLIWSLCFVEENQAKLLDSTLIDSIRRLKNHENHEISESSRGILWELKLLQPEHGEQTCSQSGSDTSSDRCDSHIMISYSWNQQGLALKIFDELRGEGRKVWMDVEKMQGDSLERMAEAVEKSSFVICCFSEDYSNSQACRSEATYAYKQKKKLVFAKLQSDFEPKGWLGFILGADIYYKLFDQDHFAQNYPKMLQYIEANSESVVKPTSVQTLAAAKLSEKQPVTTIASFIGWSSEDVISWINSIGLTDTTSIQSKLNGMTGELLNELKTWQRTAPDFFLNFCQKSLQLENPADLIKFSLATRSLK